MDRNEIMRVLNCIVWSLENIPQPQMIKNGASNQEAEMGIKFCEYLKNKEIAVEIKNGC